MREKLLKTMEEQGYNVNKVSCLLGIKRSNIYSHVKGRSSLGFAKAKKIADFLNIPLEDVYAD